jgi:hypothetical protein
LRDGTTWGPVEAEVDSMDQQGLVIYVVTCPFDSGMFKAANVDVFPGRSALQFRFEPPFAPRHARRKWWQR